MVGEKRKANRDGGGGKKRQSISFEKKMAIITKLDAGEKMVNVARAHNMNSEFVFFFYCVILSYLFNTNLYKLPVHEFNIHNLINTRL